MLQPSNFLHFKNVHVVDSILGAKELRCDRCNRDLPESQFYPIAQADYKGRTKTVLHPHCRICRQQARGRWVKHELYSPALDRYWHKNLVSLRAQARHRSLLFAIDKDDALGLYIEQQGRCALSGLKMDWKKTSWRGGANLSAPSVDRIDSKGNYILGNIQIVLRCVNMMKRDLPNDIFIQMCGKISSHSFAL